jgi:pyrimidine operon attenuation protein / uracil phosphoribosyltransferase
LGKLIVDSNDFSRMLKRISHEILEKNSGPQKLVLIGMHTRGVPIAKRIAKYIEEFEGLNIPIAQLDVSFYRDDIDKKIKTDINPTIIETNINDCNVILVDDVLYTGRSIRAAMDALMDYGRPSRIQLSVLIDRGHRELPISPDYIGKNIPTSHDEKIRVLISEIDGSDGVEIE